MDPVSDVRKGWFILMFAPMKAVLKEICQAQLNAVRMVFSDRTALGIALCAMPVLAAGYLGVNHVRETTRQNRLTLYNESKAGITALTRLERRDDTVWVNDDAYVIRANGVSALYLDDEQSVKIVENALPPQDHKAAFGLDVLRHAPQGRVYAAGYVAYPPLESCNAYLDGRMDQYKDAMAGMILLPFARKAWPSMADYPRGQGDFFHENALTAAWRVDKVTPFSSPAP